MNTASKTALLQRLRKEAKKRKTHRLIDKLAKRRARARQRKLKEAERLKRLHDAAQEARARSKDVLRMARALKAFAKRCKEMGMTPEIGPGFAPIHLKR